jgi:hypothetical protein
MFDLYGKTLAEEIPVVGYVDVLATDGFIIL